MSQAFTGTVFSNSVAASSALASISSILASISSAASSRASSAVSSAASVTSTPGSISAVSSAASSLSSAASAASSTSVISVLTGNPVSTTTPTATSGSAQEDSGQSHNGKTIGIGVGVGVGGAIIVGLLSWLFFRQFKITKRKYSDKTMRASGMDEISTVTSEVKQTYLAEPAQEVEAQHRVEMEHPPDNYAMLPSGPWVQQNSQPPAELWAHDVKRP